MNCLSSTKKTIILATFLLVSIFSSAQVAEVTFIEKAGQTLPNRFEREDSWLHAWTQVIGSTAGAAAVLDIQADETIQFTDRSTKELVIFSPLNELPTDSENPEDEFLANRNFSLQFAGERNSGMCFKTREYIGTISNTNVNVNCGQFINAEGTEMFFLVIRNLDADRNDDQEVVDSIKSLNAKMFCNSGL